MFARSNIFLKVRLVESFLSRVKESTDVTSRQSYSHLFIEKRVQKLLKKLTNIDYENIRPRKEGKQLNPPTYKLMTTEELEAEIKAFRQKIDYLLQMPPVVDQRKEIDEILCRTESLDGHDVHHAKFVFCDISFSTSNRDRTIVVREPNGILRKAKWDERHRINQIYYPIPGREIKCPKMFEDEHFQNVLKRDEYEFILDRACVQFEPDDPLYQKIVTDTYERINSKGHFSKLHSTRHFGGLVFYLVTRKTIDDMLLDNIESNRIENAYDLIKLYHIIHPNCKSALQVDQDEDILNKYIKLDSHKKDQLELALRTYYANKEQKETMESEIQKAHGF